MELDVGGAVAFGEVEEESGDHSGCWSLSADRVTRKASLPSLALAAQISPRAVKARFFGVWRELEIGEAGGEIESGGGGATGGGVAEGDGDRGGFGGGGIKMPDGEVAFKDEGFAVATQVGVEDAAGLELGDLAFDLFEGE